MKIIGHRGKKKIREYVLSCPDCGAKMFLDLSSKSLVYRCRKNGCLGNHSADSRGRPLGDPAPVMDRVWRSRAHKIFDKLWKNNYMTKDDAYKWLAFRLKMTESDCHISKMNLEQCKIIIKLTKQALKELGYEQCSSKGTRGIV